MAQATEFDMPQYIIYRDCEPGQRIDPRTPLAFFPPKDSDELFDALRAKFPNVKSHSERVREAVIEFLLQESQIEQVPLQQLSAAQTSNAMNTSPMTTSFPAMSSNTSTWSSPEIPELVTSSYTGSPTQSLSRQFSIATPSEASPPALEQMTGVFSLSDSIQPKQRTRRKMTEQEKIEYRKRRIVKACDKCSKRKRKCNHNQQDMETGSNKSQKMPRSSVSSTSKKPPAPDLPNVDGLDEVFSTNPLHFTDSFSSEQMQTFDDMSDLLDMPLPVMDFEQLLASPQVQWPWTDTPDFTLMDSSDHSFAEAPLMMPELQRDPSPLQTVLYSDSERTGDYDIGQLFHTNANREHLRSNQPAEMQQLQAIHTAHVNDANSNESFTFGNANVQLNNNTRQREPARSDRSPADRSATSMDILVQDSELIRSNQRVLGDGRRTTHSDELQRRPNNATSKVAEQREADPSRDCQVTNATNQVQMRTSITNRSVGCGTSQNNTRIQLEREKTSTNDIDASIMMATCDTQKNVTEDVQDRQYPFIPSPTNQATLGALGEGILATMSPSTELFMLRRRIPKALHSIVDRNNGGCNSTSALSLQRVALLQTRTDSQQERDVYQDCSVQQESEIHQERLSDHVRRRDHFGRHLAVGVQILSAIAGLGCLLALLSLLPLHTTNLSLLLMALVSPVRAAEGTHLPCDSVYSEVWDNVIPGRAKDSAWSARIKSQMSNLRLLDWKNLSSSTWIKETGHIFGGCM